MQYNVTACGLHLTGPYLTAHQNPNQPGFVNFYPVSVVAEYSDFTETFTLKSDKGDELVINIACLQAYVGYNDYPTDEMNYKTARNLVWDAAHLARK